MAVLTPTYAAWATITCGLAATPLASSATFVLGRESTEVDNSSNKFIDARIAGKVTVGTTPTANTQILIYGLTRLDNIPTYPDVFDGTDSDETLTSAGVGTGLLMGPFVINVDAATSNVGYPFDFLWSDWFSKTLPEFWSLFVTHNTVAALNSTAGNHVFKYQGIKFDIS